LGRADLVWLERRANLLVAGVDLPRAKGAILSVGPVRLEVTGQTYPCVRMDDVHKGLLKALARDWRGGLTCRVLDGGAIARGDPVDVLLRPAETRMLLPG
jgi:MOSC domain-containing protein YiiM